MIQDPKGAYIFVWETKNKQEIVNVSMLVGNTCYGERQTRSGIGIQVRVGESLPFGR